MKIAATTQTGLNIPKQYVWVLLMLALIVFQYVLTIYFFTMRARLAVFRRNFLRQFDKEHAEAFPHMDKAPEYGYPDTGCGYYGKRLPYADWFKMNNGQRTQINFLEQITFEIISSFIASLVYPQYALYSLIGWFFGRAAFTIGYTVKGPQGRLIGALTMDVCMLANIILMVMAVGSMLKWW